MSILIKDMEMPISCDDCEFCKQASGYDWCCIPMVNKRSKPLDEPVIKLDWCPLVHVPPHGRLIDGDLLPWVLANTDVKFESYEDWEKLCDYIRAAPTVIPAEEVQE